MQNADPTWLVSECIAGNEDAIELLFRLYEPGVFKLAFSIVDNPAEASEITQETFLTALRAMRNYQDRQSFKAWLYTIAVNHSRSHIRRRKARERLQAALTRLFRIEFEKQAGPEEVIVHNEQEAALWTALNQLDDRHRFVVVLRYFHDLSIRDIAEILSTREGTIHSRLYSAREKLRMALEEMEAE